MKKKMFLGILSAALCTVMAAAPCTTFAAANRALLLDASAGIDIITAQTKFEKNADGWAVSGGALDADGGAAVVTPSGSGSCGISTGIGSGIYRNASNGDGLFWDFENESDYTENAELKGAADLGKWTVARKTTEIYTEPTADTEIYNVGYKENGGKSENIIKPDSGVTEAIPAEGSKTCLTVFNPMKNAWMGYMGARVKLSRDTLTAGEEYRLSFWFTQNSQRRPIYFGLTPYSDTELAVNTDLAVNNGVVNYENAEENRVVAAAARQWNEYSVTFTPTNDDFSDDGYTTLWLITTAPVITNLRDIFGCEKMYLDNISLIHVTDAVKTTDFKFSMKVKGEAGKTVTATALIDGNDELFDVSKTIEKDDEWETLTAEFSLSSDMYYLLGDRSGSAFEKDNDRIMLNISANGGFSADDIHILKNLNRSEIEKSGGKTVFFITDIVGFEKVDGVKAVLKVGSSRILNESITVEDGRNAYVFKGVMPAGSKGDITFDITKGFGSIFEKEYLISPLYINGNNIYPSTEALKSFGAGRYLVEFDVDGGTAEDTARVVIGGVTADAEMFDGGAGIAEVVISASDVSGITDSDKITVECDKTVSNITVKKTAER